MIQAGKSRREILTATGASNAQYDRVVFCCKHGLEDKLLSGEYAASTLQEMVKLGRLTPPIAPNAGDGGKGVAGVGKGVKSSRGQQVVRPGKAPLSLLDKLVLDGIVGISLARKLAGVSEDLRQEFIEDISAFTTEIDRLNTNVKSVFRQRYGEVDARINELDRQIREKEEQIRHLDQEIACRRSAETFVRQLRETMTVLRDMELGLSRGDVARTNFMTPEEVDYHAATLRRIADVISSIPTEKRIVRLPARQVKERED